ncbi:conserved hypothetical protein, partial [Ricinus communis]
MSFRWRRVTYCRWRARKAERAALASVSGLSGRSSSTELPSCCSEACALAERRPDWRIASTTKGRSDQAGCRARQAPSAPSKPPESDSSVTIAAAAAISSSASSDAVSGQTRQSMPWLSSTARITCASRPRGARIRMRSSTPPLSCGRRGDIAIAQQRLRARVAGRARQHPLEVGQRLADLDAVRSEAELADRLLVRVGAALDHRDRLQQVAARLEVPEVQHRVAQVAQVHVGAHLAHGAVQRQNQQRGEPAQVQVGQQLVHLQHQVLAAGHGVQIGIEAVDHHHLHAVLLDRHAHRVRELARRDLGRVQRADRD